MTELQFKLYVTVFCHRSGCPPVSQCESASRPTPLCAASWSTSPDATPPSPPSPSSRASPGNVSGRRSSLARCALSASRPTPHCAFRPLLRKRLRNRPVLQIRPPQSRISHLLASCLRSLMSLSRRGRESRTFLSCPLRYPTSCGKRRWILQGSQELDTHWLSHFTSGVTIIYLCI